MTTAFLLTAQQASPFRRIPWGGSALRLGGSAIDGHDPQAVDAALNAAQKAKKPSLIACKTTIAYGAPTKAGSGKTHGSPLGHKEVEGARSRLGWPHGAVRRAAIYPGRMA